MRSPLVSLFGWVVLSACAAVALGCAANTRPPATFETIRASSLEANRSDRETRTTFVERLALRAKTKKRLDLLLLSGGGQHGAYGIGFLRGWKDRSDEPLPDFDLVTGVSTGSLQAPFALLGTKESLEAGAALYRNAATELAPTLDYWFWLYRTGGLLDTKRLRSSVERVFDRSMQASLAARFDEGRTIAVATTDLDLGIGKTWDLGRELGKEESGLSRAHAILLASSSIPGIFPPILLDEHVHSDGGVVDNILFPLEFSDFAELRRLVDTNGDEAPLEIGVTIVLNLWTHPKIVASDPSSRGEISRRSQSIMLLTHQLQTIERLELLAAAVSSTIPRLSMNVRFTAIPSEMANEPGASELFDDVWMKRLEAFGYERGKSGMGFLTPLSDRERPEGRVREK